MRSLLKSSDYYHGDISETEFNAIKEIVSSESGLLLDNYKDKCIKRRIAVRVRAKGCPTAACYLEILKKDEEELKRLLDALTINVTEFFRNPSVFDKLKEEVLPGIFEKKRKVEGEVRPIRIWSVGCSSGEEPYSISIMLLEDFQKNIRRASPQILATDVDEAVINKAREGIYNKKVLKELQPEIIEKYFIPTENDNFRLTKQAKRIVTFKKRNILEEKTYREQDLIFCRNMLIYFSRDQQEEVLMKLADALTEGGYLILGKAETLVGKTRKQFETVCPRERIYRKSN